MTVQFSRRSWRSNEGHEDFFSESELIGYYSVDDDNTYLPDSSKLSYYKPPDEASSRFPTRGAKSVSFDLDRGRESITRRYSPKDGKLLFTWIKFNHEKIKAPAESGRWIQPNFVCDRGSLFKLLSTPYTENEGWKIRAAKWKGTIYLSSSRSGSRRGFQMPADANKFFDWSQNFDQYMKSDFPNEKPGEHRSIVGSGEFRGVYKFRFGDNTVLFDAAIKAVISEKPLKDPLPLKDLEYVQLAMSRDYQNDKQEQSFRRFKLLKWWCNGFLTNTAKCVCGFRDDEGIVHRLVTFTLEEMIAMSKSYWKPSNCVHFCEAFLGKLSDTVVDDCFETIYTFERKPHEYGIHIDRMLPSSRYTVIPPSFIGEDR